MICKACRTAADYGDNDLHDECEGLEKGETWCDCQHMHTAESVVKED